MWGGNYACGSAGKDKWKLLLVLITFYVCARCKIGTLFFQMLWSSFYATRKECVVCWHVKKRFTQDDLRQFSCFDWSKLTKEPSLEDQTASILGNALQIQYKYITKCKKYPIDPEQSSSRIPSSVFIPNLRRFKCLEHKKSKSCFW